MMERRRWPRPTFSARKRSLSSGPRCASVSVIRRSTASFTGPGGCILTTPQMPHICGSCPPLVGQTHPRPVLGEHKAQEDLGSVSPRKVISAPPGRDLTEYLPARKAMENHQERAVQGVVVRRAQISMRAVPAPLSPVIPPSKVSSEAVDSIVEKPSHSVVMGLCGDIKESQQSKQEPVEDAWQWENGKL